ncbi:zinc ribbon domain-containing protein [Okeania sp. SIO2C9]|uniref:zinc ribbon domain-containing protein n=1 Tax=Okeania sp. SIO2C9 TaxID=2607791 RepID=UPI00345D466C
MIELDGEVCVHPHSCPHCGIVIDRDLNAAINIKNRAVGYSVLKARACPTEYRGCETRSTHYSASERVGVCHNPCLFRAGKSQKYRGYSFRTEEIPPFLIL